MDGFSVWRVGVGSAQYKLNCVVVCFLPVLVTVFKQKISRFKCTLTLLIFIYFNLKRDDFYLRMGGIGVWRGANEIIISI